MIKWLIHKYSMWKSNKFLKKITKKAVKYWIDTLPDFLKKPIDPNKYHTFNRIGTAIKQ